jgi:hypothetical protein
LLLPLLQPVGWNATHAKEAADLQQGRPSGGRLDDSAADRLGREPEDDEGERESNDEGQFTPIVEELFLGVVVYPQEKDEVQLTLGYFDGVETAGDTNTVFEIEYGITDRFQIGLEVPLESVADEPFDGVRTLGFELYWNCYSDPSVGRALGLGFDLGMPVDSAEGESRAWGYEPFVVAYQEWQNVALNVCAALEVEDAVEDESGATSGEVAFGLFPTSGRIIPLVELSVEMESDETPILFAPGLYGKSLIGPIDLAISLPIGLNHDAPDFSLFFLAVLEFDANILRRRSAR